MSLFLLSLDIIIENIDLVKENKSSFTRCYCMPASFNLKKSNYKTVLSNKTLIDKKVIREIYIVSQ